MESEQGGVADPTALFRTNLFVSLLGRGAQRSHPANLDLASTLPPVPGRPWTQQLLPY